MTNTEKERQKAITTAGNPAKPTGEAGTQMLERMNESHDGLSAEVRENIEHYHLYNPTPETFETIFRNAGFSSTQIHIEKDRRWICVEGR